MKLHREGKGPILLTTGILLAVGVAVFLLPFQADWIRLLIATPFLVLAGLVLWFFRIPKREVVKGDGLVVAPADGKIVVIEKVVEEEYFKDERIQISIFMSPLNVHQNVYPTDGKVTYTRYHKGDYLVAWHPKSSTQNERSTIVIENKKGVEILVRQIAGAVARRICTYAKEGDLAESGAELGFIKFGSRVDVFLPPDADIECVLNQKSTNKQTILARL